MSAGSIVNEDGRTYETWPIAPEPAIIFDLLADCFAHWADIVVGPMSLSAAWEIVPPRQPKLHREGHEIVMDFGDWHAHVAVADDAALAAEPNRLRRTGRVTLYRRLRDGKPASWGIRLHNGAGVQQMTIILPSPLMDARGDPIEPHDWSRLGLWDAIRQKYLALAPDPLDLALSG